MRRKGVMVILFNHSNEVLLVQQNNKEKSWTFVSGVILGGESEMATAVRELKEQTGISIVPENLFYTNKIFKYRDFAGDEVLQFVFLSKTENDYTKKVFDEEINDLKWVKLDAVQGYLAYEDLKIFFNEITPIIVSYISNAK